MSMDVTEKTKMAYRGLQQKFLTFPENFDNFP